MGAPYGNVNALKGKPWGEALRAVLNRREQAGGGSRGLRTIAEVLIDKAADGDLEAIKELGNRLDGRPAQQLTLGGDPDAPLQLIQRTIVDGKK